MAEAWYAQQIWKARVCIAEAHGVQGFPLLPDQWIKIFLRIRIQIQGANMLWIQRILFLSTAAKTKSPTSGNMIPLVTAEVATITLISPYINSHSQNKLIGSKKKLNSIRFRAQRRPKQDSIVIKCKVKKSQNYESSLVNAERVKSLC